MSADLPQKLVVPPMSKKFIMATDPLTPEQEQALRNKLGLNGFWHWLPNFWLVKSLDPDFSAVKLREMVEEVAPLARCFMTEVVPVEPWAARAKPDSQGNSMTAWIKEDWESP